MKRLKLGIWIFAITLIQIVVSRYFNYNGVTANVMLAFAVAYAAYERELSYAMSVTVIIGAIAAAISTRSFWYVLIMVIYSGALIYIFGGRKIRRSYVKLAVYAFAFVLVGESLIYFITYMNFEARSALNMLLTELLPTSVVTAVVTVVLSALLVKSFGSGRKKSIKLQ